MLHDKSQDTSQTTASSLHFVEPQTGLNCSLHKKWLTAKDSVQWWDNIVNNVDWYRVKYESNRFRTTCETPCYTTFYGGDPKFSPYVAIPNWLQPLVDRASKDLLPTGWIYNSILIRLYFDGKDEIAWHTDGRTFLGKTPTIGSLSLGASATFEMRKMNDEQLLALRRWQCRRIPRRRYRS